jgi:hypothetical protein
MTLGVPVERQNRCGFCNAPQGVLVAQGDFWDLARVNYVRCEECGLIQVDPMLSEEVTARGCQAYYSMETLREGRRNLQKKMIRSFRKGVHFAYKLKRLGFSPRRILEVGAGDGYFSRGVQFVFPEGSFTCLDIVPEVLANIRRSHGFETVLGSPENIPLRQDAQKYDLIIARDIIEHTVNPRRVIDSFASSLSRGGMVHIITPNGFEDIWMAYCRWQLKSQPADMLINHVNFFPPQSLKAEFERAGLRPRIWYIYDFNGTRWGRARYISEKQMADASRRLPAADVVAKSAPQLAELSVDETAILRQWWIQPRMRWITRAYCLLKEARRFVLPADSGIGHEIFGVFEKV